VARHAQTNQATVRFEANPQGVRMIICDHGVGFDQAHLPLTERQRWGLRMMAERAESVNGTLRIKSSPQAGTLIIVEVPR
jgi:two-component system sensor histidine kinase DegS